MPIVDDSLASWLITDWPADRPARDPLTHDLLFSNIILYPAGFAVGFYEPLRRSRRSRLLLTADIGHSLVLILTWSTSVTFSRTLETRDFLAGLGQHVTSKIYIKPDVDRICCLSSNSHIRLVG